MAGVVRAVAGQMGLANPIDAQIEADRGMVNMCAGFITFAGFLGILSSWAVYYFGFLLAIYCLVLGIIMFNHSRSPEAVLNESCCFSATTAFGNFNTGCCLGLIGGIIGIVICLVAVIVYVTENVATFWIIFAVIAAIGCIICTIASGLAMNACKRIQHRVNAIKGLNVVTAVAGAVMGAPVQAQPAYGHQQQHHQQQQPYAQNQPYGQQQQGGYNQNQNAYGQQPAYGQPQYNNGYNNGYGQQQQQPYGNQQQQQQPQKKKGSRLF